MAEYKDNAQRGIVSKPAIFVAATAGIKAAAKRVAGRGKGAKVKAR
jgi:hypothetical protein